MGGKRNRGQTEKVLKVFNAFGDVWLESTKVNKRREENSQKKVLLLQCTCDDSWSMVSLGYN